MLPRMPQPLADEHLPVNAARGDARHRDVRAEVFAAVPQPKPKLSQRIFWRVVLFLASSSIGLKLLKKLRGR
jgi:hypothetical protein